MGSRTLVDGGIRMQAGRYVDTLVPNSKKAEFDRLRRTTPVQTRHPDAWQHLYVAILILAVPSTGACLSILE